MFKIGDKVVYPMHGLGVITSIEEKEFAGEKKQYYTIQLMNSNMDIMISAEKIASSRLRLVTDIDSMEEAFSALNTEESKASASLSQKHRYQRNMEKMKSGDFLEDIEVIRDLTNINNEKNLNANEMQMLTTAREFIINEIALIRNISKEEASDLLDVKIS